MTTTQIVAVVCIVLVVIGVVYRLPTKKGAAWTPNEKVTVLVSIASLAVAVGTLILSVTSTETRSAVEHLAQLAGEAQRQTGTLNKQVGVISRQLAEQTKQTGFLSAQARAAGDQARASQASVSVSQGLLASAQAGEKRTVAQLKYQMRYQAMLTFQQGDAAFDSVLNQIRNRMGHDIEERGDVEKFTSKDLEEIREASDPIIAAANSYDAAINATIPAWPVDVRHAIMEARNKGMEVAKCYDMGAMRALTPQEVELVRLRLNANCRDLGTKYQEFRDLTKAVNVEMQNEVFNDASEVGTRPNFATPDSVRPPR